MFKRIFSLILAITFILSFAACGEKTEVITTERKEETAIKADETETVFSAETTVTSPQTEVTRIDRPIIEKTTSAPQNQKISAPDSAVYYSNGQKTTLSKEKTKAIVDRVNALFASDDYIDVLKSAVTKETIEKIKGENKCVELIYNSAHSSLSLTSKSGYRSGSGHFNKILLHLDDDYGSGIIYFANKDVYQSGPWGIGGQSTFASDILNIVK